VTVTRGGIVGVATLAMSACSMAVLANPAQAYVEAPYLTCYNSEQSAEAQARNMRLEPANEATVQAGPVVFSGKSPYPLTFSIASSPSLLPNLDVESGIGSQSGAFYRFTSTEATAKPGTVYWTASFTFAPDGCESPSTFTTPVRTLIVAPSEAELAASNRQRGGEAGKKKLEEEAAKNKLEEEAAAAKREEEAAGSVILDGVGTVVDNSREAAVKLTCSDVARCAGKLTLTASATVAKGRARHVRTEGIGTADFSIAAGGQATVKVPLDKAGRALLSTAHGLRANLTIVRTSPVPNQTETQHVRLKQRRAASGKGSG
jgi:hypothetical protein